MAMTAEELALRISRLPGGRMGEAARLALELYGAQEAEREVMPFRQFIQEAWPIIEPSTPYVHGWHIDAIIEHLQAVINGQIRRLVIAMPPRHAKSTVLSVLFPSWVWTFKPETRWIFASYSQKLSIRDSVACRNVIRSAWYQRNWGGVFQMTPEQDQKTRYRNNKTGERLACSTGSPQSTGEGATGIVVDDAHSMKDIHSDKKRESVLEWWDQSMSTRLNDPATGFRVIVGQRGHEMDLSGHVLKRGGYEILSLPARYEKSTYVTSIGWKDPRKEDGQLLWPERFPEAAIADLELNLGPYGASAQLQQRPAPAGGGIFQRHWWRFWYDPSEGVPDPVTVKTPQGQWIECKQVPLPDSFEEQTQSWDMAFKDTEASDYVVGQVWGNNGADRFLRHQVRGRMSFVETKEALREVTADYPEAVAKLIEGKANGPAVISDLEHDIEGMLDIEPEGGKVARAHASVPVVHAGNVYLPHPDQCDWVNDYIHEHAIFPKSKNDDQVDASSQYHVYVNKHSTLDAWGGEREVGQWEKVSGARWA